MTDEPTIPVPMTRAMRSAAMRVTGCDVPHADRDALLELCRAYDAAVARPVEPGRTVRWCETHDEEHLKCVTLALGRGEYCDVTRREVGGVVGGGA